MCDFLFHWNRREKNNSTLVLGTIHHMPKPSPKHSDHVTKHRMLLLESHSMNDGNEIEFQFNCKHKINIFNVWKQKYYEKSLLICNASHHGTSGPMHRILNIKGFTKWLDKRRQQKNTIIIISKWRVLLIQCKFMRVTGCISLIIEFTKLYVWVDGLEKGRR